MSGSRRAVVLWCVIGANVLLALATAVTNRPIPALDVLFLVVIMTMHALRRYRLAEYLVYALIAFVVSNLYESLSVLTAFPFGDYYYPDNLGPKLFLVPLLIAPSYFAAGYFAWSVAHILLGRFGSDLRGRDVFFLPLIATFVMVMWDLVLDPIASTVRHSWIWEDGGGYFGVPFVNYMGWLLCVYTIFQLFAFYLVRRGATTRRPEAGIGTDRGYWYQAIVAYFSMSLIWALRSLTPSDEIIADPAGQPWHANDIFQSMTLVAIFTMWFVCLLSAVLVNRATERQLSTGEAR